MKKLDRSSETTGPLPGALAGRSWSATEIIRECLEVSVDTLGPDSWTDTVRKFCAGVLRIFRVDKVWLAERVAEDGGFRVRSYPFRGRRGEEGVWVSGLPDNPFGWVGTEMLALWRNDLQTDLRFSRVGGSAERGSEILVPLIRRESCWGVIGIRARRRYAFRQEDLEALECFAGLATLALDRSKRFAEISQQALLDGLTGVINRGGFGQFLQREVDRCRRFGRRLSILLIDLDDFKLVNDTFGHPEGDRVLKGVVRTVQDHIRRLDLLARYGGEEFVVLLPETPTEGGERTAEKIRRAVAGTRLLRKRQPELAVTLSIGVAGFPEAGESPAEILRAADQALYRAKSLGKNRVVVSGTEE